MSDPINTSVNNNDQHYVTKSLSNKETREVLTPFAFEIDKSLYGIYLATPWKRGVALLVDLFLIALLSSTPSQFLAFVVAVSAFKLCLNPNKDRAPQYSWLRKLIRYLAAFVVFSILFASLPIVIDVFNEPSAEDRLQSKNEGGINVGQTALSVEESIEFSVLSAQITKDVVQEKCKTVDCWHEYMTKYIDDYAKFTIDKNTAEKAINTIIEQTKLTKNEQFFLSASLYDAYLLALEENIDNNRKKIKHEKAIASTDKEVIDNKSKDESAQHHVSKDVINELEVSEVITQGVKQPKIDTPTYSVIKYITALIEDLGLGFGWAALYFTMFTVFWNGQTPGKKMLYIRVMQLDGKPLSFFDSFGRYGGYGAGIATGLLGFIQIFWDANRQGIQDKIASTIVIDLTKNNKI